MKKQINHLKNQPNFILANQGILRSFQGTMQDFAVRHAHPIPTTQQVIEGQDFLIIDNQTGEIIKA